MAEINTKTWQVKKILDKITGVEDIEWSELAQLEGFDVSGDHLRRMGAGVRLCYDAGMLKDAADEDEGNPSELRKTKLEKQKMYDLRREVNEVYRATARDELLRETILDAVDSMPPIVVAPPSRQYNSGTSGRSLVVTIADCHYGRECKIKGLRGETINEYSPEIFERRMAKLLDDVVDLVAETDASEVVVAGLGDSVDGLLRVSQIFSLRYGLVDSTMRYTEYLSQWLNVLSKAAPVRFVSIGGNHDVVRPLNARKASDFPKENLARIIAWFTAERLKDNPRVEVIEGGDIELIDIQGFNALMVHGDCDKRTGDIARDYGTLYSVDIDIAFRAHLHSFSDTTCGINRAGYNIYEIQAPSICGIDEYAISLKKTAAAGSVGVLIERNKGKCAVYMLPLD